MFKLLQTVLVIIGFGTVVSYTQAASLTVPNTFSSGTPAVAAEVNANFTATKAAVDDNDGRVTVNAADIARLQASIARLQATVTSQANTITTLRRDLNIVENNSVLALDGNLISTTDINGYATAQFTGVNVQVINGVDETTLNGLGNLIVGYNEPRTLGDFVCSEGVYNSQGACEGAGLVWARNHKTGSHNLVAGNKNSYSRYGGVVFGDNNVINGVYANVSGGRTNIASGGVSSVSGGNNNIASATSSSVCGGRANEAKGAYASVSGGGGNTANGLNSSVSGGNNNTASGQNSSVSGGFSRSVLPNTNSNWAAGSLFEDF